MVTVIEIDRYAFANGVVLKDPRQFKIEVKKWKKLHPNCILKFKKLKLRIIKNKRFLPKGWKPIEYEDEDTVTSCSGGNDNDPLPTDIRNGYINGVGGYD